jgi:cell division protein FtsA
MNTTVPGVEYVAAIDIGTTKICVLIGLVQPYGGVEIVGIGRHPSYGLKKGIVVNMSATVESIKRALKEAQAQAEAELLLAQPTCCPASRLTRSRSRSRRTRGAGPRGGSA